MDPHELLLVAFRASIVYFLVLILVRVLGKREVGNFGPFDLIVALIIGESVDEAIYGDVTMLKFIVLIVTIGIWELVNSYASYKSKAIQKLTESSPTVLVKHGKIIKEAMDKERMGEEEIESQLRMASVDDIKEVKQATLEPNGQISVVLEDWAKPVQKSDLPGGEKPKKKAAQAG